MFISVLRLSRSDVQQIAVCNQGVFDAYTLHKTVYSLFPKESEETRSFLYADRGGDFNEKRILILSKKMPKDPQIGKIETQEVPSQFLQQDYYGFEVLMNPVRCDSKTKKKIPIRGNDKDALKQWFLEKAAANGFEVAQDSLSVGNTRTSEMLFLEKPLSKDALRSLIGKSLLMHLKKDWEREKLMALDFSKLFH